MRHLARFPRKDYIFSTLVTVSTVFAFVYSTIVHHSSCLLQALAGNGVAAPTHNKFGDRCGGSLS